MVFVKNDYEIDLTNIDSVCINLNGFWINETKLESDTIIYIKTNHMSLDGVWRKLPFNEKIQKEKMIPVFENCNSIVFYEENDSIYLDFYDKKETEWIDENGVKNIEFKSKKIKIDYLSRISFEMNGKRYLRHKGYDFLK